MASESISALLLLFTSALLSYFVTATPQEVPSSSDFINCAEKFRPGTPPIGRVDCLQFRLGGYPTRIGRTNVDFYVYANRNDSKHHPQTTAQTAEHLNHIRTSLDTLLPRYAAVLPFTQSPSLIFVLASQADPHEYTIDGETICDDNQGSDRTCFIWISDEMMEVDPANKAHSDGLEFERVVAHELYHAFQRSDRAPYRVTASSYWWFEGSAEFFGTFFYPEHRLKISITEYYPNLPLYNQSSGYGAGLFFLFLWNHNMPLQNIHEFVMRQIAAPDDEAMKSAMSKDAEIKANFPLFAQAFKDKKLFFSDRKPVQLTTGDPDFEIQEQIYAVKLSKNNASFPTPIKVKPFAIAVGVITLEQGQTYTFNIQALPPQAELFYRASASPSTEWLPFTSFTVKTPCARGNTKYEFIFTSTGDREEDTASLVVTRNSKTKCLCKRDQTDDNVGDDDDDDGGSCQSGGQNGFIHFPLLNEITLDAMCPKGTHGGIAPWCCPDGLMLDEAVLSEITLCCLTAEDCSKEIVPDNLRCADPSWVLWQRRWRDVGCCMKGFVPNSMRYCVDDPTKGDPRFSIVSQAGSTSASTSSSSTTANTESEASVGRPDATFSDGPAIATTTKRLTTTTPGRSETIPPTPPTPTSTMAVVTSGGSSITTTNRSGLATTSPRVTPTTGLGAFILQGLGF